MRAWEEIERARSLFLADGNRVGLSMAPPLSQREIADVARRAGAPLPRELVELLARCGGLDVALDRIDIDFSGRTMEDSFEYEDAFPRDLPVARDGCGNLWVLDLTPETTEAAPVFFACRDAPVILYQSPDLGHFVREVIRMCIPPHRSLIDDVHEDRLFDVWRKNPGVITRASAAESADPELRAFASALDDRFSIVDLRSAAVGMGFSWGRYGPKTVVRRHGAERIFAYARPERQGLGARWIGRG